MISSRGHSRHALWSLAGLVVLGALAAHAQAQQPAATAESPSPAMSAALRFNDRLEALRPDDPEAYFLLGEEVLDAANDAEGRRLAITLLVLSAELDRTRVNGGRIAASACLALSQTTRAGADRHWLSALAQALDAARTPPEWTRPTPPASVDSEAYKVATTTGYVRSGDGGRAKQLLAKPEVRAALQRYDKLLSRLGAGTVSSIQREAERWPCPECGNERAVKRGRGDKLEYRLCPVCSGNPGPRLSRDALLAQLRFESWILHGVQRSWGAQVVTDSGAPLLDPDPTKLALIFEVDSRAVYWRLGRWCRSPDGSNPAEPGPLPAAKPEPKKDDPSAPATSSGS